MTWRTSGIALLTLAVLAGWGCAGASRARATEAIAHYQYGDMFSGPAGSDGIAVTTSSDSNRGYRSSGGAMPTPSVAPPPSPGAAGIAESRRVSRRSVEMEAEEVSFRDEDMGDFGGEMDAVASEAPPAEPVMLAEASPAPTQPEPAETTAPAAAGGSEQAQTQSATDTPTSGPLLIYTAELNLAVHEVRERIDQVVEVTDDVGGFLQSQDDTSVIIRVPAAQFRDALARIEALGDVLHRRVAAQDVSDQVRDVRIRLRNAVQMRDRLAELLERAETVPDSLTIERELERLTQTIELLRGQLRSLSDRIAYSTITVRFEPIRVDQEVPRERFRLPFPWLDELGLVNLLRL